jgi:hypothetical protein
MWSRTHKTNVALAFAAALCAAVPASAQVSPSELDSDDMAWFYNREGATAEQAAGALRECASFGNRMALVGQSDPQQYGLTGMGLMAIVSAGPRVAYADDCMMARGYRRFNVAGVGLRRFQERLQQSSPEVLNAYAGAATPPEGVPARVWVNSYWLPAAGKADPTPEARDFAPYAATLQEVGWRETRTIRALDDDAQAAIGSNQALVVATVRSTTGAGLRFDRAEPDTGMLSIVDRKWLSFEVRTTNNDTGVKRVAYVVPAGTYALGAAWTWRWANGSEFCLGTVAVQVEAGQVVDLGEFALDRAGPALALTTEPRARLRIDQPAPDGARVGLFSNWLSGRELTQARYFNQFPRHCRLNTRSYGFDMPGAPVWSERAAQQ